MYVKWDIEESVKKLNSFFPVLLVTGARQVGKTTVLKNCAEYAEENRTIVSLAELEMRNLA